MAMRTATPLVTCWVTTVRGRSATSEAISTPRTMGPGWVTMASSPRSSTRRDVRPQPAVYSRKLGTNEPLPAFGLESEQGDHVGVGQGGIEVRWPP